MRAVNPATLDKLSQRAFSIGLALYVLVLPVKHTIALRYLAIAIIAAATIAQLWSSRKLPAWPIAGAWIAYAAVALSSLTYAVAPAESFSEIRVEVFYGLAIFVIAATWSRSRDIVTGLGYMLAAANAIYVVTALKYGSLSSTMPEIERMPSWALAGVNPNFILTVLPLIIYLAWKAWRAGQRWRVAALGALVVLDMLALLLSYNRQAFVVLLLGVACGGSLALAIRFTWRRLAVLAMLIALIVAVAGVQMARREPYLPQELARASVAADPRWALWRFSAARIAEHPFSGGGFGRDVFARLYPELKERNGMLWHAHNMVLNKGIQMGLPGVIAWLALWFCLAWAFVGRMRKDSPDPALAATGLVIVAMVFAKNMMDDVFVRDMAQLFWLVTGALIGSLRRTSGAAAA